MPGILCSILLGMYAIYIIRNIMSIAGANTEKSSSYDDIQLDQLLMIELMVIWGWVDFT